MKKVFALLYICILLSLFNNIALAKDYNVMIGANKSKILYTGQNDLLVIDASFFTQKDIKKIHKNANNMIFSYLNIGSIEEFRADYTDYKNIILAPYDNWNDEYWIDICQPKWQKRISDMSYDLNDKGIDGFFLDNADIYGFYKNEKAYNAIITILKDLKSYGKKVIINGGDEFIKEFIKRNEDNSLIYGINQEGVLTRIDFENIRFLAQLEDTKKYFTDYLSLCKQSGLEVFVLEYMKNNKSFNERIKKFCDKNGYKYMISDSLALD